MDPYTEVYTWGSNTYGQMGLESSSTHYSVPRICSFGIIIQQVSCGLEHSAFISSQHYVYTMGSNADGRLGISDKTIASSSYPLLVEALSSSKVCQISCGAYHTAAVTHEGDLYTWGKGAMLGHGDLVTRWTPCKLQLELTFVIQVSCGENHSAVVCIKDKEKVCMTWGLNSFGQLALNSREAQEKPARVALQDIKEVACGADFTLFLNNSGQVFSAGKNSDGQLGHGNTGNLLVPKRIKTFDSVFISKIAASGLAAAVSEDGQLFVWGDSNLAPKQVRGCPKDIKEVSIGHNFFAALTRTSSLWTMGSNHCGQLGVGDSADRQGIFLVESLKHKRIKQVACGSDFLVALGDDLKSPQKSDRKELRRSELDSNRKKSDGNRTNREQFWSSERNEVDENLYESALKKMNLMLSQTEKQLQVEKETRVKNEEYKKLYYEIEEKFVNMMKNFEVERARREELELIHTKNEAKLLQIIRDKEAEVLRLKNEVKYLKSESKEPCRNCVNIINEFQGLKAKNESVLIEITKTAPKGHSPEVSTHYVPQSPSFDKSLDKSIERHKAINNQLKVSRSESELLKLIDDKNGRVPGTERTNEQKLPLLKLDFDTQGEVALPTFRGQENSFSMQRNLKNSIADIKARINTLNSNRSELQSKMEELETKLVKSTQRYYV